MTQAQLINILNITIPLISGAVLAAFGLATKYFIAQRYIFRNPPTWIYIILSACGALLITAIMLSIGTKLIQNDILNSILLGLFGGAIFLGIITKVPIPKSKDSNIDDHIKTIRDYMFDYLDKSNLTKQREIIERKIKQIVEKVEPATIIREAHRIAGGLDLNEQQRMDLVEKLDKYIVKKDFYLVIRELVGPTRDRLDYIYAEMMSAANVNIERETIIQARGVSQAGLFEFAMAEMYACQKEPEKSLSYLQDALRKEPSIANNIKSNDLQWMIFTNMTDGENQQDKLLEFFQLIDFKRPSLSELRKHCYCHNSTKSAVFMAVKKSNGRSIRVTVQHLQAHQNDTHKWSVIGEEGLAEQFASFDEVIDHMDEVFIPTKLILNEAKVI